MNELVTIKNNEIEIQKEAVEKLRNFQKLKLQMDLIEKEIKEGVKQAMETLGKKSFAIEGLAVTYKAPTTRKSLDSKKLKEELPDIYEEYLKESNVSSSVTLTISE